MIINPLAEAEDIQAAPLSGTTALAVTLLWVVNTATTVSKVTVANSVAATFYIPAGEGVFVEKERGAVVEASTVELLVFGQLLVHIQIDLTYYE